MEEIMSQLSNGALDRLYTNPWTCVGVLQMLSEVEQQWLLRAALTREDEAPARLAELRLVVDGRIAENVATHFVAALGGLKEPWETLPPGKKHPSTEQLTEWMVWRWTTVLIYVTGEDMDGRSEPQTRIVELLKKAGIMRGDEELEITSLGLEFLLRPRHEQIWELVKTYLSEDEDVVSLLLTMSFCTFGNAYPISALTDAQRACLPVLGGLGLLYQRSKSTDRFYPTRLGIQVAFGGGAADDTTIKIIVQTNFQVMAYTDAKANTSALVVGMLSLFATLRCRLPNLVIGDITRTSVRACVGKGIAIDQIFRFLQAHKKVEKPLPANVLDQMRLWAGEDNRVKYAHGSLIANLPPSIFPKLLHRINKHRPDWLLWHDDTRLFVHVDAEPSVRRLLRPNHAAAASSSYP
ncbi:hypothetical protein CTAYLR_004196 [Chrysophaeum taylorii]|uniref:General transcription factor IIH subunit 4 n=1 Tax=Chrysophaeum taylorii TaxID=2483200 RepID=A0AAD7UH04_9STRA|nr:hypothetical protein CTAYLR_004196 [Chrysophaeum taylorii]